MRRSVLRALAISAALAGAGSLLDCGGSAEGDASPDAAAPPTTTEDADGGATNDAAPVEDPLPPTEGSGTRFRVRYLSTTFADGATRRTFFGFQDTKLGVTCTLHELAPGQFVCLPQLGSAEDYGTFADQDCTKPVLVVGNDAPGSPFMMFGSETCPPRFTRASVTRDVLTWQRDAATGECVSTRSRSDVTPKDEVPASTFGAFARVPEPVTSPERSGARVTIAAERLVSDDGAFQALPRRVVDRSRNATGDIAFAADRKRRVVTTSFTLAHPGWFGDDACTQKLLEVFPTFSMDFPCSGTPLGAPELLDRVKVDDACTVSRVVLRPPGPPLAAVYARTDPAAPCKAVEVRAPGYDEYPVQPLTEVSPDAFAEVATRLVGTTLNATAGSEIEPRTHAFTTADGLELRGRDALLYLKAYDLRCDVGWMDGDTAARCVPVVPSRDYRDPPFYADSACTKPVSRLRKSGCDDPGGWPFYRVGTDRVAVYRIVSPGSATGYQRDVSGACVRAPDGYEYVDLETAEKVKSSLFPQVKSSKVVSP